MEKKPASLQHFGETVKKKVRERRVARGGKQPCTSDGRTKGEKQREGPWAVEKIKKKTVRWFPRVSFITKRGLNQGSTKHSNSFGLPKDFKTSTSEETHRFLKPGTCLLPVWTKLNRRRGGGGKG